MKTAEGLATPTVERNSFGQLQDGSAVDIFNLKNGRGMNVSVITYGGTITRCTVPDRNGDCESVVLGFDNLEQYLAPHPRFGALIGRFANRIGNAEFTLDGQSYKLAATKGTSTLHGGIIGFDKKIWTAESGADEHKAWLKLHLASVDLEEGFPGNLDLAVTYTLDATNALTLSYEATTDKATPVNFTNHSYFNLSGAGNGDVLGHLAQFNARFFTPVDDNLIPTGEIHSVKNTPFDFGTERRIGDRIAQTGAGYDHNLVITGQEQDVECLGSVRELKSGRILTVHTDQPGFQFFTANSLSGVISGVGGAYPKHGGFCLETQHFPDSVHQRHFPNTIVRPGDIFKTYTRFSFSTI